MWFPFASLQVFFCNKFLRDFALTLAVSPWPLVGLPAPLPFPAPEQPEGPVLLRLFRTPSWGRRLGHAASLPSAPRSCVRSGGPWKGEAETQTWGWIIKWCHWQPIGRADVTRLAAPAAPLSLPQHRELPGSKPAEVHYFRVKCTWNTVHHSCSSWDSKVSQDCRAGWELFHGAHDKQAKQFSLGFFFFTALAVLVCAGHGTCVCHFWCVLYTILISIFILCYTFKSYIILANPTDKL